MKSLTKALIITTLALGSTATQAIALQLGGPHPAFRIATLDSAVTGTTGSGNATVTHVETAFGGDWTERASVAGGSGGLGDYTNGDLKVTLTSGAWGSREAGGTWEIINSSFWDDYKDGAISMHVGNGGGEPDHFIWFLTEDLFTGTWNYDGEGGSLSGGGLSNMKLYSRGEGDGITPPTGGRVPDGGATAALLGLSLLGLGVARKALK